MESILERLWRISKDIEQGIVLLRLTSDRPNDVEAQLEKSEVRLKNLPFQFLPHL